jgi:hypothetical protein
MLAANCLPVSVVRLLAIYFPVIDWFIISKNYQSLNCQHGIYRLVRAALLALAALAGTCRLLPWTGFVNFKKQNRELLYASAGSIGHGCPFLFFFSLPKINNTYSHQNQY